MSLSDANMTSFEQADQRRAATDRTLEALLNAQAEALFNAQPFEFKPEQVGLNAVEAAEAYELLHLAKRLSESLVPVLPTVEFMTRLRNELIGTATPALILRWRKLPSGYRLAARLGGITLTAGLALLASRRMLGLLNTLNQGRAKADITLNTVP